MHFNHSFLSSSKTKHRKKPPVTTIMPKCSSFIHSLDQKFYLLRRCLPDAYSGKLLFHHTLPSHPCPLLFHACSLAVLISSSVALTSSSTLPPLTLPWALFYWGDGKLPKPVLPFTTTPTTALCLSFASALSISWVAVLFLPVQISIPAAETFGPLESRYCNVSVVRETSNPSMMLLNGS